MPLDPAAAVNRWIANETVANAIIQGPAVGAGSIVNTDGGPVPTLAKAIADVEASPGGTGSALAAAGSAAAAAASAASAAAVAGNIRIVRVAAESPVTIANPGTATFDGVALLAGDRVLLWRQTVAIENGIYDFHGSGTAMTRSADSNATGEVVAAMLVAVAEGTRYGDTIWMVTSDGPITIGTSAINFTKRAGKRNFFVDFNVHNGTATNSTTMSLVGFAIAWKLTPNYSGRVRLTWTGWVTTNNPAGNATLNISYGTGAAPAAGTAAPRFAFPNGNIFATPGSTGGPAIPVSMSVEVSGLALNTEYWFDIAWASTNGSVFVGLTSNGITIEEVPND